MYPVTVKAKYKGLSKKSAVLIEKKRQFYTFKVNTYTLQK